MNVAPGHGRAAKQYKVKIVQLAKGVIVMRILRGLLAVLVWLLATVVMIVAAVLCITLILLPLGLPLMAFGLRLYGYGVQLMLPRAKEVKRKVRKGFGLRPRGSVADDAKGAAKQAGKSRRRLSKKARSVKRDAQRTTGRGRSRLHEATRRAAKAVHS
jgi:hypothetical protein